MAETTVVADAVPPVVMPETDAAPSARPAASPRGAGDRASPRNARQGGTFPPPLRFPSSRDSWASCSATRSGGAETRTRRGRGWRTGRPGSTATPRADPLDLPRPQPRVPRACQAARETRFRALDANAEISRFPTFRDAGCENASKTLARERVWTLTDFKPSRSSKSGSPAGRLCVGAWRVVLYIPPGARFGARREVNVCRLTRRQLA